MQLSDFHYNLPDELIAQVPLPERTSSRLLCMNRAKAKIEHKHFTDLLDHLQPNDLLVFNNTKVIPARLFGQKDSGGKVEILVQRVLSPHRVSAMLKVSKAPKITGRIILDDKTTAEVIARQRADFILYFHGDRVVTDVLNDLGHMPLPPYIKREDEIADRERYQTVYASEEGAIAAPTAGLHFDDDMMARIEEMKIEIGFMTLHVGAGTFQPVRVDNITDHKMHSEFIEVDETLCEQIKQTKARGGRVIAIGTTTVRSLETAALDGEIAPFTGDTDIFIYPGYQFNCIDAMVTNFHLPESTLIMLVCAFAGYDFTMKAYREAVTEQYRFFSYGDAMFIE